MFNSMYWLALTLSLCSPVLNEEVFESYATLTEPTSNIYALDITSDGGTLVVGEDSQKTHIYSISGTTITHQQTITHSDFG